MTSETKIFISILLFCLIIIAYLYNQNRMKDKEREKDSLAAKEIIQYISRLENAVKDLGLRQNNDQHKRNEQSGHDQRFNKKTKIQKSV